MTDAPETAEASATTAATAPAPAERAPETAQSPVLVVDFGAQYAQLIARRVREANVYSEIVPHTITAAEIAEKNPVGIVLSGGPSSVYEEGAPSIDAGIFDLDIPVLGICYGFQAMAKALGGVVPFLSFFVESHMTKLAMREHAALVAEPTPNTQGAPA